MKTYHDDFENWQDVANAFRVPSLQEPEEVIFAQYAHHNEYSYDADAMVIYRNGDEYAIVEGGHCSCYGLEDQWEPEEYDLWMLIKALEKRRDDYAVWFQYRDDILANLRARDDDYINLSEAA